eukprot:m.71236 g.71236  ORF g.71236 m.71236 type:complete len:327 (+) comp14200_c0_seq1:185-1165(+)
MSMQLDDTEMITGNDAMFGWTSESHQNWLDSMATPPCSPPPDFSSLGLLADPSFALPSAAIDGLVEPLDSTLLSYEDFTESLTGTPLDSFPCTPGPTPFGSGATTPSHSRSTSPTMHLNILEDDDLMMELLENRSPKRHRHQPSPFLEQTLLFESLAAIAENPEDDVADHSSAELSSAHPSSCPPSASNSPPMHRASSAPSSRRGSGRRRKSATKRSTAAKPLGRKPSAKSKAKAQNSEQAKREIHNVSERQRRQALKDSFDFLRKLVPSVETDDRAHTGRILQEAVSYIKHLEQEGDELAAERQQLMDEHERLKQQLEPSFLHDL